MKQALTRATSGEQGPQDLRERIQHDDSAEMRLRRAIVASSLVGLGSMAIVSMFQTGMIRHLPDPPLESFHSDKVNSSSTAYGYGMPDGPITLAIHAANLVLAAAGLPDRARERPWLPVLAAGFAGAQAAVAAKYLFHQMPKVDRAFVRLLHHRRAGALRDVRIDPAGGGEGAGLARGAVADGRSTRPRCSL